jgi:NADH dehydrogenase
MSHITTVFGGTGFLGQRIVQRLSEAGHSVRVAARHCLDADLNTGVEHVRTDVRDAPSVARALRGARGVVNTVGLYVEHGVDTFDSVHVQGAAIIARETESAGARLVHLSGIGVDGASPSKYVRARARGEDRVRSESSRAIILRPSALFGPADALLTNLDLATRHLPFVPMFGRGDRCLQPVYVDDVAAAVLSALDAESAGGVYELGGPYRYTYRELLTVVLHHLGRRRGLVPIPFVLWEVAAACLSVLPSPLLTRDQIALLRADNVVGQGVLTFEHLGITPRPLANLLDECLPRRSR